MEIYKIFQYFWKATHIPVTLVGRDNNIQSFSNSQSVPSFFAHYISPILKDMNTPKILLRENLFLFGILTHKSSGTLICLGPLPTQKINLENTTGILPALGLSSVHAIDIVTFFSKIPIVHFSILQNYLVMLSLLLNDDDIAEEPIFEVVESLFSPLPSEDFMDDVLVHNSRIWENVVLSYILHGKPEELAVLLASGSTIDIAVGITANDVLRAQKNIFVTTVSLASRTAVRGGVDYETAMTMSDEYLQKMESIDDYNAVGRLLGTMAVDFATIVQRNKQLSVGSVIVHKTCDYITTNIYNKISAADIARKLGISTAYLSHRFKADAGINLSHYITQQKITEAKNLLCSTEKSILEIAELLAFSSQSYFHTLFRKTAGVTPAVYRSRINL